MREGILKDIDIMKFSPSREERINKKITKRNHIFCLMVLFLEHEFVKKNRKNIIFSEIRKFTGASWSQLINNLTEMEEFGLVRLVNKGRYSEAYPILNNSENVLSKYIYNVYACLTGTNGSIEHLTKEIEEEKKKVTK